MKLIIKVRDASYATIIKNNYHTELMWTILSYSTVFKRKDDLVRNKASAFSKQGYKFGLGLMPYVKEKLKLAEEEYEIQVPFKFIPLPKKETKDVVLSNKTFENYQIKALNILDNKIKRGIIQAPTAAGKTTIAAGIIDKFNRPNTLIVTPTKDIARNTVYSLNKDLNEPIGIIGDNECFIEKITVCLYQSLRNIVKNKPQILKHLTDHTKLIIWDEAHLASKAINECLIPFVKTFYRFGLTATPKLKYKKDVYFKITGQLGPIVHKITEKQAEKRVVNDVKAIMWNFYDEPTQEDYLNKYRYDILLNVRRCKLLCEMVEYSFKQEGRFNCLMLVDQYDQAKLIEACAKKFKNIPAPVIVWSGIDTKETERIKAGLNSGEIPWVIATPKFSVGTDIPEIETIIVGSARKSIANLAQKVGRGRRKTKGKDSLLLMDTFDILGEEDKFFEKYSINRRNFYIRKKWFGGIEDGNYSS